MAKLTISDAARVADVARSTLYRTIQTSRLRTDPDGHVDTAELLRAGYTLQRGAQQPTCIRNKESSASRHDSTFTQAL